LVAARRNVELGRCRANGVSLQYESRRWSARSRSPHHLWAIQIRLDILRSACPSMPWSGLQDHPFVTALSYRCGRTTARPLHVKKLSRRVKQTKQDGLALKYRCGTRLIDWIAGRVTTLRSSSARQTPASRPTGIRATTT